ncbi:S8 family peptidase [Brevibacillus fulvus]|uniref:SLH domain-containing protein n=1 Tax=Brevibacillus fulvus TaxID=1125967 RepID=A0A938Y090_9BACL|nr:S8 family serine peptidase [Brevibacillus fulvus]MBM7591519.1 hypothetical protein [Brevibacillus fulvus]
MKIVKPFSVILLTVLILPFVMAVCQQAEAAVSANDHYYPNQSYLKRIRADAAWSYVKGNTGITIAVLDSGVDYNHPDLKGNLLPGINLVNPGRSAQDDEGHGTSVAGILAAKGNNQIGVAGVLWNAKILPIKVIDKNGSADNVDLISQGIELAVNRGAKIILMSLESNSYSKRLEAAVKRAEARGVLLVASTGNEGNRVAYPAAYPTVVAVGALGSGNQPIYQSNYGPELNLLAPGSNIYTTKLGGGYGYFSGTSAAAPQVAGAAALVWARNPKMTAVEVRQLLYQTAADLEAPGWDRKTGYGLLDVGKAVRSKLAADSGEPNNSQYGSKPFPIESQIRAQLSPADPIDWYYMDVPYDGKVTFTASLTSSSISAMAATFYPANKQPVTYYVGNGDTLIVPAKQGRMYIKLQRSGGVNNFIYLLTSKFSIDPDSYERNNDALTARPLVGNQINVVGNFHEEGDTDWFSYYVRQNGRLAVSVTADTNRIDLELKVRRQDSGWDIHDSGTRSDPTERAVEEVTPGKYFIQLSEYWSNAVNAEYKMNLTYTPEYRDTNEPNDTSRTASRLLSGSLMVGTLPKQTDYDWFYFDVDKPSYVLIQAPMVPVSSGVRLSLYSGQAFTKPLLTQNRVAELSDAGQPVAGIRLNKGRYYIRLNSVNPIKYDPYRLVVNKQVLVDGFRDIATHWARPEIARLSAKGVVKGFADATFRPDAAVTRGQFASMLMKAIKANGMSVTPYSGSRRFADLSRSHWAYTDLMTAYRLGILQGYPNNTIKPDQPLTRAEMALMVARAQSIFMYKHSYSSYRDVSTGHWASPAIEALTSRGWLHGVNGSVFKPNQYARRGEMVVLLAKAYHL